MSRSVRSLSAASEELAEAVLWYETRRPGLGADFIAAVDSVVALIEEHPDIGEPASGDLKTRQLRVHVFPYYLVYRQLTSEIVIVAFAHTSRRPGFWKDRT